MSEKKNLEMRLNFAEKEAEDSQEREKMLKKQV